MKVYKEDIDVKIPIKSWCNNPEDGALVQAINLANLPFLYKHVCLMPDTHQGYGMPIGGVIATIGVVIPNAVGVDIGCGMLAVKTSLVSSDLDIDVLKKIIGLIRNEIPVGFEHHKMPKLESLLPDLLNNEIIEKNYVAAQSQVGTLGGGNHFIEIQKDEHKNIWFMVHSGSRNVGKKVADFYNKEAVRMNEKWYSSITKDKQLAFLPIEEQIAKEYLIAMNWCCDFSFANRDLMSSVIKNILTLSFPNIKFSEEINIHHNYARWEHHFGKNVLVHRKGATSARKGEIGIVPGSQGTASYIAEGLGNVESFTSCSHGAGRKMGRKQAQRELNFNAETKRLNDNNILHSIRGEGDLDEAPGAYKDIDVVMEEQSDLVKIKTKLLPLAVVKG